MPVAGTQTSESEKPSAADRIVDAVQHAAHMSHEARLVKLWHTTRSRTAPTRQNGP